VPPGACGADETWRQEAFLQPSKAHLDSVDVVIGCPQNGWLSAGPLSSKVRMRTKGECWTWLANDLGVSLTYWLLSQVVCTIIDYDVTCGTTMRTDNPTMVDDEYRRSY
jgi:hypothetical protein